MIFRHNQKKKKKKGFEIKTKKIKDDNKIREIKEQFKMGEY